MSTKELSTMLKACRAMRHLRVEMSAIPVVTMPHRCLSNDVKAHRPKAVIFDMGGVLVPSPVQLFIDFEKANNLSPGTVAQVLRAQGKEGPWWQLESGQISLSEFGDVFRKAMSQQTDVDALVQALRDFKPEPFPAMLDTIHSVRNAGIKTALLTNNWFVDESKTEPLMLVDQALFDVVVQSCVTGFIKPRVSIYYKCLEELKVQPGDAVFLDDLGHNIEGALAVGMRTIMVTSPEQGAEDLHKLLGLKGGEFTGQGVNIPGTVEVPQHLELDMAKLETYLNSLGLTDDKPPVLRMFEHGLSNPTYFLSYGGRQMVLRKKPPGKLLPSAHAVDREYRIMVAMRMGGVPVPNMVAFCQDESVVGTQFYLMDYLKGTIHHDFCMPELPHEEKRDTIMALIDVMAKIHSLDIDKMGLSDYGKRGKFVERNFKRWSKQYESSKTKEIPAMDKLMAWIPQHLPKNEKVTVIHGDFRLDNLMFRPGTSEPIAMLDWELSTLGDPITDLATCLIVYCVPRDFSSFAGLIGVDLEKQGVPSAREIVERYCEVSGLDTIPDLDFYMAHACFRYAAIMQGVHKRFISGQASSSQAATAEYFAEFLANKAWDFAKKGFFTSSNPGATTSTTIIGSKRMYSTLASPPIQAKVNTNRQL